MKKYVIAAVLIVLVIVSAYVLIRRRVPFETIEHVEAPGSGKFWFSPKPGLQILTSYDDVITPSLQVSEHVSDRGYEMLLDVDYETYFVVIAYAGTSGSGHEGIEIQRIVRQGEQINIYANMGNSTPDAMQTSPYHSVLVHKKGSWGKEFTCTLFVNQKKSVIAYVP